MSIITFSLDSSQERREIVEKTAESLGYKLVDRRILSRLSEIHNIPEGKLERALDEIPSFPGRSFRTWKQYLAYVQEAVLGEFLNDNVVCWGLAAHLYVLGVSHVLRVSILHDHDEIARLLAARKEVSFEKARKIVRRKIMRRKRWSLEAFNIDETDPSRYDMVINISQITHEEAVSMITTATGYRKFRPMTYSIKCMQDRELESRVYSALLKSFPGVRVQARDGTVVVEIKTLKREKQKKAAVIKELAGKIPGVNYVEVHVINDIFRQAAESGR